jgi:hypothetical protein
VACDNSESFVKQSHSDVAPIIDDREVSFEESSLEESFDYQVGKSAY